MTITDEVFRVAALNWDGGESLAEDSDNAANALAGLLIDAILAHGMAFCCLHAAAVEIGDALYLFAGPSEAGTATMHVSAPADSSSLLPISDRQSELFPVTEEVGITDVETGPLAQFVGADDLLACFEHVYVEASFEALYEG